MGGVVDGEQAFGIDRDVALRRRQAGVAEQLLDRSQVSAAAEQVGREAVAQCVRCRRVGQAEQAAQGLHLALHAPTAIFQEVVRATLSTWYRDLVTALPTVNNGVVSAPRAPGLGLALNPDVRRRAWNREMASSPSARRVIRRGSFSRTIRRI